MSDPIDAGHALDADRMIEDRDTDTSDERTRMSFLDHLDELRRRIMYSLYAIMAACAATLYFWDTMFVFLVSYFHQIASGVDLVYTRPMGAFLFSMKVGVLSGLLLASPFVFAQLWLFVAPGLYTRERRVVIPFVVFASLLFAGGAAFAHFVAFPAMWKFFASYDELAGLQFLANLDDTFSFYVKTIIGLGLVFQMPILVYFLARFGIVTARFMWRQIRYAILIIIIAAAVITPSGDPVTLIIFAAPMTVLYLASIGVAWLVGKRKKKEQEIL